MAQIVLLEDPDLGPIYLEIDGEIAQSKGMRDINLTSGIEKITGKLDNALASLKNMAKGTVKALQALSPDEIEMKMGVKFTGKEGAIIGLIVRGEAEAAFEVTLKWKNIKTEASADQ